ncbi:activating transcription factor 7-interacting protein 1 isoform X2 [Ascaphus truei]
MDNTEEPQKKVFKARKTMKASDRQQLEAVHKAKEELLKPTEFKLVNGNHENGDSDINSPHNDTDYMADKKELNGIIDVSIDSHEVPIVKLSDIKEDFRNLDQTRDLKVKLDEQPSESIACQEDTDNVAVSEVRVQVSNNKDGVQCEEKSTVFGRVDQSAPDGLTLEEEKVTCDTEPSEEKTQLSVPGQLPLEEESSTVLEGTHEVKEEKHKEEADEEQLAQETLDMLTESQEDKELEVDSLEESLDAQGEDAEDGDVKDDILEEDILEEDQPKETKVNQEDEQQDTLGADEDTEEELTIKQGSDDLMVGQETGETLEMVEEEGDCAEEEKEVLEMHSEEQDAGEEAISSSMEIDQNQKDEEQKSDLPETTFEKSDLQTGSVLESTDSMETDDIIPILEKLAPVEDEMQCFSKTDLHSESAASPDEEKTEHCLSSPSKQESSETLPSEAFLVLSDEEEPCDVAPSAEEKASSPQGESSDILEKPAEKKEEQKKEENEEEPHAEKSEGPRRKRSKSEDLDSQHSKRRRYEEEYEAELQLKITAGDDLNKKLQKVVQELLEEKLSALQCAVFDKTLADLKNRVEKIECKKHETVLNAIQAKIARLTKRFGAAKEDLKKRPEQTTTTQPASPGKPANEMSANGNLGTYRNANTVRQMLESKRNVGDIVTTTFTTSATGQPPISPVPSLPPPSNVPLRTPNTTQLPATQSPANNTLQGRAPPDWKLIQQRINATSIAAPQNLSSQPKLSPPATSASVMTTSVLPAPSTATVVGNSQVSGNSSSQPMSVSLQSLPVILHVPMSLSSQSQLLQGTTGTLVTNQQSGSVEFIPAQNQAAVSGLNKTSPVSLAPTKPMNSPSISSPGIQRNSPANSGSMGTPLSVQAVTTTHSIVQSSRSSLPVVGTSAIYTQAGNRNSLPMKVPLSGFNSPSTETPIAPRPEPQTNRTPTAESVASKRAAESTTQLSEQKVVQHLPYPSGIFDGITFARCTDHQMKREDQMAQSKQPSEVDEQNNICFPENSLFNLEEEEGDFKTIKNTHKQTGWAANLLRQWLSKNGKDSAFEELSVGELDDILQEFYYTIRNHDGNTYSIASYKSMRAGLNRHLRRPPHSRQICLMKDTEFASANLVFVNVLKRLHVQGKDDTKHHPPITADDLRKIKLSGILGLQNPQALVNKVWFDLQLHFSKRGREILRDLAPDAFVVQKDKNGRQYAMFRYPGKGPYAENPRKMGKMYDMPGDPNCPVFSLKLYLSKLPPKPAAFYLHPIKLTPEQMQEQRTWFKREPMGVNYLGTMMPRISVAARLSRRYTNHSLRATTIQLLCEAGLGPREIMAVTGHRSESAIKNYWGAAEIRCRAWADMDGNNPDFLYKTLPNEIVQKPVSCSFASVGHIALDQKKLTLFSQNSVLPASSHLGINCVPLVPQVHMALDTRKNILVKRNSPKLILPKNMAGVILTGNRFQGCYNEPVFNRLIKQEPMT